MSIPGIDLRVEIAFNAGWNTPSASRVWTDVSEYVELEENVEIRYGRSNEMTTAEANRLDLDLNNTDGRFTYGNPASPYYPNIKIGRPIRVVASVGGADHVRFTGYVNEWPTEWPGGGDTYCITPITASSRLARLGLSSPLGTALETTLELAAPPYYWPMTEAAGSTTAVEANGTGADLTVTQRPDKVTFGYNENESALGVDDGPAIRLTGEASGDFWFSGFLEAAVPSISFGPGSPGAVSVGAFVRNLQPGAVATAVPNLVELRDPTAANGSSLALSLGTTSFASASYPTSPTTSNSFAAASTTSLANDGQTRHIAASLSCDGINITLKGYLDGVLTGSTTFAAAAFSLSRLRLRSPQYDTLVGRIAYWPSEVSATQIADIAKAGLTGFAGETTGDRLLRYATWAGIPAGEVVVDLSAVTVSGVSGDSLQIVDLMRQIEIAEAGVLHDDRTGKLVLESRQSRYVATPSLTLDAATQQVGSDFAPSVDLQSLANVGRGRNAAGTVEVAYSDEVSRQDYGDAGYDVETVADDPDEPLQLLAWVINANGEPRPRVPSVTVNMLNQVSNGDAAVLDLDIGSLVTIANPPSQAPTTTADYFFEGCSETFGEASWFMTMDLSPGAPANLSLILDSATKGVLDAAVVAL